MKSPQGPNRLTPPAFSQRHIIGKAEELGAKVIRAADLPPELFSVSFDFAYEEVIYPEYGISLVENDDLGFDEFGQKIYGSYDPIDNVAFIDQSLKQDPRRAFTCWHEVGGHGILQGDWLRKELGRLRQRGRLITNESALDLNTENVLEWQANLFAAHAGAPTPLLYHALEDLLSPTRPIRYIGPGTYTLVFRGVWHWFKVDSLNHLCRIIAKQIQWRFGFLSVEALSYRIQSLSIIDDVTRAKFRLHRRAKMSPTIAIPTGASHAMSFR